MTVETQTRPVSGRFAEKRPGHHVVPIGSRLEGSTRGAVFGSGLSAIPDFPGVGERWVYDSSINNWREKPVS